LQGRLFFSILFIIVTVSSYSFVSQNLIHVLDSAIVFSLSSDFGGSTPALPTETKAASAAGDRGSHLLGSP
jgi:hypothetical protein